MKCTIRLEGEDVTEELVERLKADPVLKELDAKITVKRNAKKERTERSDL